MAFLGWWDGELRPDAWFDAELQPKAWFDTDVVETSTGGGSFVSASTTETAAADSTQSGVRTSAASTVEATADPYLSNVKLLLHGEGADDSTTIADSSLLGSTPSCIGNARIRTAQKLFGESSLAFDGSNDRIEIPHNDQLMLGTEDFTIEFSVYFTSLIGRQTILSKGNGTAGGWVIQTGLSDGKINFYTGSGLTLVAGNPGGSYFNSVWYRYAIVKNGSTVSIYAGGGLIVSGTISEDLNDSTSALVIGGGANFDPTAYSVNGYIDEVRITKGVARYTSFYTPVSQPFPDTASSSAIDSTAATSFSLSASAAETATSLDAPSAARTTSGSLSEPATASESPSASSSPTANAVESTGGTADALTGIKTTPASLSEGVGDDFYQNVELLLHSNGANASTTFTDTGPSPKTLTAAGGAQVSTTQSKFGGSALRIGAIADSVNMTETLNLSSGSYTIEAFVWFSANGVGDGNALLSTNNNTFPSRWTIDAYPSGGNTLIMRLFTESNAVALSGSTAYTLSTWAHIAVVNNVGANTCILYINGTQVASRAATQLSAQTVKIGKNSSAWAEPPYYIDDLRITKAARYTSAFTPPALTFLDSGSASDNPNGIRTATAGVTELPGDPTYSSVSLLLHGDGANGSTAITDSSFSPKTLTANGNAQISTALSKFGASSLAFDGTGDFITAPNSSDWDVGAGDFTLEMFVYVAALPSAYKRIFTICKPVIAANDDASINLEISNTNRMTFAVVSAGTYYTASDPSVMTAGAWEHWAVVRTGTTLTLYRGGSSVGSVGVSTLAVSFSASHELRIGRWGSNTTRDFAGNLDEIRFTKGTARYTGSFTPPSLAFPDATNGSTSDTSTAVTTVVSSAVITETGSPTDAAANSAVLTAAQAEANTSTDAPSATSSSGGVDINESAAPAEASTYTTGTTAARTEPLTATDAPSATYNGAAAATESATATDMPAGGISAVAARIEPTSAIEATNSSYSTTGSLTDLATAGDAATSMTSGGGGVIEAAIASDTVLGAPETTAVQSEAGALIDLQVAVLTTLAVSVEEGVASEAAFGALNAVSALAESLSAVEESLGATAVPTSSITESSIAGELLQGIVFGAAGVSEGASALDGFEAIRYSTGAVNESPGSGYGNVGEVVDAIWRHRNALTVARYLTDGDGPLLTPVDIPPELADLVDAVWADTRALSQSKYQILKE